LAEFVRVRALARLYQEHTMIAPKLKALVEKTLAELAENHLLYVLTAITFLSNESREFFQRLGRGLQSDNKANLGNALEVLSNAGETELAARLQKVVEERSEGLEAMAKVYMSLFAKPLEISLENYAAKLYQTNNPLLRACLYYGAQTKPNLNLLRQEPKLTQELLGMAT